jgi:pentatricopeptide repeat protein
MLQWRRAIRLLDLMWQCGGELCPDIVSYNTVIKACGNAAQIDMGFKVCGAAIAIVIMVDLGHFSQ